MDASCTFDKDDSEPALMMTDGVSSEREIYIYIYVHITAHMAQSNEVAYIQFLSVCPGDVVVVLQKKKKIPVRSVTNRTYIT